MQVGVVGNPSAPFPLNKITIEAKLMSPNILASRSITFTTVKFKYSFKNYTSPYQ